LVARIATGAFALLVVISIVVGREASGPAGPSAAVMRKHVEYLASDDMGGREAGRTTIGRAEEYIAAEMRKYGLRPLPGHEDLFVDIVLYSTEGDIETAIRVEGAGKSRTGRIGRDVRPFGFSEDGERRAEVVFAGYGVTAAEYDHDDYDGLDVENKFVLVFRHEPRENDPDSNFDGTATTSHALFSTKAANAEEHGAAGMILVTDPLNHAPGDDLRVGGRLSLEPPQAPPESKSDQAFLAVQVSREMADVLVRGSGQSLEDLQRAVDAGTMPADLGIGKASATIEVHRGSSAKEVSARNVVGYLEGNDPTLKDQWIMIGGHHDHIGSFEADGDSTFNGADDNASGVSGVLEIARVLASSAERPARSLVFATFTAEEKGLLGSRALAAEQLVELERVVFMLNLDMIGRNPGDPIDVYGDGYVRGLRQVVEAANETVGLSLEFGGARYVGNSDHDSFYRRDIPFMFFFTGTHPDYHQLGDHAEKLDYPRMERIVELGVGVVATLAGASTAPTFVHHVTWLGIQVEPDKEQRESVITGVEAGSKAEELGLQVGDRLLELDGAPVAVSGVGTAFRGVEPGTQTTLGLARGGETVDVSVTRAKTGYMGVMTGGVDEDRRKTYGLAADEGIVLRRVMPDGPSGRAGLRDGDVLIRIAGQPVGTSSLRSRLSQIGAGEEVQVTVVREGERIDLPLTLGERPQ
jgi:hypothetical protein